MSSAAAPTPSSTTAPTVQARPRPGVHRSVLVTPHWAATQAGEEVLRAGGSAVDAAIAAAATLSVVYPHNTSLGGDLVALVRTADGRIRCVNATGPAGAATDAAALRTRHGGEMPVRGADTITVPGAVRGWEALAAVAGRLPWAQLLAPAVRWAREGVPVSPSLHRAIGHTLPELKTGEGLAELLAPGGRRLRHGELLVQTTLADTLEQVAAGGPSAFYTGDLAGRLVDGLRAAGSSLTVDDFQSFTAEVIDPLAREFAGRTVVTSPPNTQGFALLRTLAAAAAAGVSVEQALTSGVEVLARELHDCGLLRDGVLADLRTGGPSADDLMTMDPDEVPDVPVARRALNTASGDTVGISAVDDDGTAVSLIQSVYGHFGSFVLDPSTGVLFQNRGSSFSLEQGSANLAAPGRRPSHTLMPVMTVRGDRVESVCSVMGGKAQPQVHAQVLLQSFAGRTAAESVSAPRWVVGPLDRTDPPEGARLEADADDAVADALDAAGFAVTTIPATDEDTGQVNLVLISTDGAFDAAADPRADGSCVLVELRSS